MTKQQAIKSARKLLARMNGRGWKIRVWKNSEWYYAVETDRIAVHTAFVAGKFHCLLKPHYTLFGTDNNNYRDPNRAVNACLKLAAKNVSEINLILKQAELVYE